MKRIGELKNEALSSLDNEWGHFVLLTLIYVLIVIGLSCPGLIFQKIGMRIVNNVYNIIVDFLAIPLGWGFVVVFLRHLRQEGKTEIGNMFDGYKNFSRIFLTLLLQGIYTVLWLLLIVPGIIKALSYSMTSYILLDNPELQNNGAIERSMKLMEGHKADLFVLDLSFIGWAILCLLTCGIGFLWLAPYFQTTHAAFYHNLLEEEALRENAVADVAQEQTVSTEVQ